ncbi:MAG: phosphotransferase [Acidobacteriota bacterium]|nr:MAG: phosphotransferase [Acidobacteriota bacterium]
MTTNVFNRRIVLLTAGIGSRLGTITEKRNKGLLSINNKAILTYIIESLPHDVPIVVGLGYYGDQVRSFLKVAHPERRFIFRTIDPYAGPGSSSGFSLYSVRELVPGPFIFCTNDTIVQTKIGFEGRNWVGVSVSDDIEKYTTVSLFGNRVTNVYRKGEVGGALAYTGLAEIHDAEVFWESLKAKLDEMGECSDIEGLYGLLPLGLSAKQVDWLDTGTKDQFDRTTQILGAGMHLPKEEEDIYFQNGRVIKFYSDPAKAEQRVARASILGHVVPQIEIAENYFYSYRWVEGEMLSHTLTTEYLTNFLQWAQSQLWLKKEASDNLDPAGMARNFYYQKTKSRLRQLYQSGYVEDSTYVINGTPCKRADDLLDMLDDRFYAETRLVNFHGDLHPDNILAIDGGKDFVLLDWRENFAGVSEVGDMYYDLAKFYHGLLVSHEFVKADQIKVAIRDHTINIDIPVHYSNLELMEIFKQWTYQQGLSVDRLLILVAIIFLNNSPLHHYPYNQFLYFLGVRLLHKALVEEKV